MESGGAGVSSHLLCSGDAFSIKSVGCIGKLYYHHVVLCSWYLTGCCIVFLVSFGRTDQNINRNLKGSSVHSNTCE